ncbi:hypothetical protein DL765_005062 [Monosporascus sp. GIB2]|nr:hypothetical protein DL765_005062 [Monosporascus sp. GIB2]
MPAPTAPLKQPAVEDLPAPAIPDQQAEDEGFALEGMDVLPADAGAVLQPVAAAAAGSSGADADMDIDEESKPRCRSRRTA